MSSPEPSGRRLGHRLVGPVVVGALVLVVVACVVLERRSGPAAGPSAYREPAELAFATAVSDDEATDALRQQADADKALDAAALEVADDHDEPVLATVAVGGTPTPVLVVPSDGSFDLVEVVDAVPEAFSRTPRGELVLEVPMVVGRRATLTVDSRTVPELLLRSEPGRQALIRSNRASLTFLGHDDAPLQLRSYDPATGEPDDDPHDGRAYVMARGGRMDFDHVDVGHLGYPSTGLTSGVAWIGSTAEEGVSGSARDTTFHHGYYGAYSANARGLVIERTQFVDNEIYGFDPHTATNDTTVVASIAARNGRHGMIFSEGCLRNVIRDSESYLNGGAGFMIDDGTLHSGQGRSSDDNLLVGVVARDNRGAGIVIEGGRGNRVEASTVRNNGDGVWVRNQATDTVVEGTTVEASRDTGIRLEHDLGPTRLSDATVSGSAVGIRSEGGSASTFERVVVTGSGSVGLQLDGDQSAAAFHAVAVERSADSARAIAGSDLSPGAAAGITTDGSGHHSSWSVPSFLHPTILLLWGVILVVPLVAVAVSAGRRHRHRHHQAAAV